MVYNKKYDRWFTKGGLVFRYDEKHDRLVECKQPCNKNGYIIMRGLKRMQFYLHRAMVETFIGEIPEGMCIDHIDTNKTNNAIDNLKVVTHKENTNNPITLARLRKVLTVRNKTRYCFKQRGV